ncbi:MAG: hypothetical protein GY765_12885, partial [bacterium]|nr:hypothetical protein [bacterium]
MNKKKLVLICVLLAFVGFLHAKTDKTVPIPSILADNQQITEKKLVASGNVEIAWDEYRIFADYLEYNQETKEIIAK